MSGMAATWLKIVGQECFEPACQHALMQLQSTMRPTVGVESLPTDPMVAVDANSRMHGAREVLEILASLSQPDKKKEPQVDRPGLHYD